jgi:hypothetical protein
MTFATLLWLQLGAGALSLELTYLEPDWRRIAAYVLPLILLVVQGIWRLPVVVLLMFPTSLGAVLVVAPQDATASLASLGAVATAAGTLVGYVLASSLWLRRAEQKNESPVVSREPLMRGGDRWKPYRATFVPRAIVLVGVFCVSAAAVPLHPRLAAEASLSFGSGSGIILCNLILFFTWAVLGYSLFLAPALEQEAQIRHLETKVQAVLARTRHSRWRRLMMVVLMVLAVGLTAALWTLREA